MTCFLLINALNGLGVFLRGLAIAVRPRHVGCWDFGRAMASSTVAAVEGLGSGSVIVIVAHGVFVAVVIPDVFIVVETVLGE